MAIDFASAVARLFERALTGGADELSGDNLVRRVVDGIVALRTRGRRGAVLLPEEVEVVVTVERGSLGTLRAIVEEPGFEEEVSQRLLNRLVEVPASSHPFRIYRVVEAPASGPAGVEVRGLLEPVALELVVRGGNRDGEILTVPSVRRELRLGRGPFHGSEHEANDLVVTDEDVFVSRRAARLRRLGGHVRVRALDQKDALAVVRATGERIRPHRSIAGWAAVRPGDVIELSDGASQRILLELRQLVDDAAPGGARLGIVEE